MSRATPDARSPGPSRIIAGACTSFARPGHPPSASIKIKSCGSRPARAPVDRFFKPYGQIRHKVQCRMPQSAEFDGFPRPRHGSPSRPPTLDARDTHRAPRTNDCPGVCGCVYLLNVFKPIGLKSHCHPVLGPEFVRATPRAAIWCGFCAGDTRGRQTVTADERPSPLAR